MAVTVEKALDSRIANIINHGTPNDWCHVCGVRSDTTADVRYPENAEHNDTPSRYIRICCDCGRRIVAAAEVGSDG